MVAGEVANVMSMLAWDEFVSQLILFQDEKWTKESRKTKKSKKIFFC
jgi:hypothetical protein